MGIINVSPDSFSRDGMRAGKNLAQRAVRKARQMEQEGAALIDVGGESTRPGASPVSAPEEIRRVIPVVRALTKALPLPISVDTYKTDVARQALDAGASIINNIMGVKPDRALLKTIQNYGAAVVLMHMRGTPRTMQKNTDYRDIISEIIDSLRKSIEICLEIGIKSDKIIVDPGIGFGKTAEQNLEILKHLQKFTHLGSPVLIGTSRKSFIGKILGNAVGQRLLGTAATVCVGIMNGAHIVRVHDVREIRDAVRVTDAILNADRPLKTKA
ncbi:MAG: dihydropteroate synthase [Candidatus Omnitrophota bacterium]|nr:dihydropteroate synthase [Candidatus Omnitrophota bacterium]